MSTELAAFYKENNLPDLSPSTMLIVLEDWMRIVLDCVDRSDINQDTIDDYRRGWQEEHPDEDFLDTEIVGFINDELESLEDELNAFCRDKKLPSPEDKASLYDGGYSAAHLRLEAWHDYLSCMVE